MLAMGALYEAAAADGTDQRRPLVRHELRDLGIRGLFGSNRFGIGAEVASAVFIALG